MLLPRCGMRPVTFLPQGLRLSTGFWAFAPHCRAEVMPSPSQCHKPKPLIIRRSSSACQNRAKSCWVGRRHWPGVPNAFGVRSLRIIAEESRRCRSRRAAGERGVGRPDEADRRRRSSRGASRRDCGADPGGHAGDRDFQPALYRERRALHDGDADVLVRHRESAHHRGDLHPRKPSPGHGAL